MFDPEIITAEIKNATQWKTDSIFFITGIVLFLTGIVSVVVTAGYIIYQIIWKGMEFPSTMQVVILLSGVVTITLGAFLLFLIYEDTESEEEATKKIMFPDG
jgi:D-alanyl-lipoteichoic acid acyltransferase DltB (MBOAT superfamily)